MPENAQQSSSPTTLRLATLAAVLGIISFFFIPICGMAALILGIEMLGVISFVCFPICGLAALIIGVVAKKKISRSNGRLLGKEKAKAGITLGTLALVCFPLVVALFLPPYIEARHKAQESYCTWRLTSIAMVCNNYANDNDGRLPTLDSEEFKARLSQIFVDQKLQFECPRSRKKYRLFVNGQELSKINAPANTIFAVCDSGHRYDRITVAFADNHCESLLPESHGGGGWAEAVMKAIQNCPSGELPVLEQY